jgi:hypothetical protein
MANGTTKPIKDVKVGDKVIATDPQDGERAVRTVLAVHINHDTALTDLTVKVNGHDASSTPPSITQSGTRARNVGRRG